MDDAAILWLVIAAVLFALDVILGVFNDPRTARVRLVSAGLLALAIALIVERN